ISHYHYICDMSMLLTRILFLSLGTTLLIGCNPFSPRYNPEGLADINLLGDPTHVEGYFRLFKNAYELRDTTLYGRLFASDFTFSYYDPDLGQDISWDRDTELATSYNLFQGVLQINLDWNYYTQLDTNETEAIVIRNFNLTIEETEETVYSGAGRAKLRLKRNMPGEAWQAYEWFDDSDF
ncbi:MAG: hypothetical protein R3B93_27240, partial [Bacteroidia bacterium]